MVNISSSSISQYLSRNLSQDTTFSTASSPTTTTTTTDNLKRNRSNRIKTDESQKKTNSRIEAIRRAFTTSRPKGLKSVNYGVSSPASTISLLQNYNRHDQTRSVSVYSQATPLYISPPDIEQLHEYTTLPLSPPSTTAILANTAAAINYLPELSEQQDTIVRQMAILYIDSKVDNDCIDLNSLLAFSSSASTLWERLKSHILTPSNSDYHQAVPTVTNNNNGDNRIIGVSLSNLTQHHNNGSTTSISFEKWVSICPSVAACFSQNSLIPNFLKDCILAMIEQDITTEGIFRKNGNIRGLKEMCEQLDLEPLREDWSHFFMNQPIIQSAAFIKRFLRELPEPLLTYKLHKLFLLSYKIATDDACDNNDDATPVTLIHYAICLLPKANRDILLATLALLKWVARHSDKNKMTVQNLARVMAPNILYNIQHNNIKVPPNITRLLEHPKMSEVIFAHSIDLTSSKHFIRSFGHLLKVKKEVQQSKHCSASTASYLPPSPSIRAKYHS
ncbi:Rho GTPase activation protein [Mycotypha africana]|uniref:Rho GTPase activation protein n=1 Tax=Mycotypha africana TaxID=64632 RepID=UPI0023018243|nr:Rho GTPase activation protein [Mycotypha africana]KAI8988401.1 Rho GTPase activation protein [Mycotypha africana]